ncbi:hypothetical protein BJV82DRAFT_594465 [Fennellomyces sp. T-0311]|nr:hypothetical protein BJV82DRAFT_594465 [Fennellomyces sp. T-0311]
MQTNPDFYKYLLEEDPSTTTMPTPAAYPPFFNTLDFPTTSSPPTVMQYQPPPPPAAAAAPPPPPPPAQEDFTTMDTDVLEDAPYQVTMPTTQQQQTNTTIDFRRRRNWSERILNEITGLLHVLSPVGKILHCSPSSIELTGYSPEELVGRSLTDFLHVDDIDVFIRDFNRAFHTRSQIKVMYRFRKKDQNYTLFETIGHPRTDVPGQPPRSFFAIAQPYPTRMGSLFDSFLELKMENEWLKQRLREIPNTDIPGDFLFENNDEKPEIYPPRSAEESTSSSSSANGSLWLREDAMVYGRVRSPVPTSAPLPPASGLASTGVVDLAETTTSAELISHKDKSKRRKKQRGADEYVCTDCGTATSPEWRKGPHGPKTLCNACGLRWAKKSKKKGLSTD